MNNKVIPIKREDGSIIWAVPVGEGKYRLIYKGRRYNFTDTFDKLIAERSMDEQ
jgi:hypothetical protein